MQRRGFLSNNRNLNHPYKTFHADWDCPQCGLKQVFGSRDKCPSCGCFRSKAKMSKKPGDWDCSSCGKHNFAKRDRCYACGKEKSVVPASPAPSLGGGSTCSICLTNTPCMLIKPCKHCCTCKECMEQLNTGECPMCRTLFIKDVDVEEIFIS